MSASAGDAPSRLDRLIAAVKAVANADPHEIEAAAHELGTSRRYLAPIAWAGGTLVLLVRGVKLLVLNWRLSLIELVPAVWVWFVMWDLRRHALRSDAFRQVTPGQLLALVALTVTASIAAFWCNTLFAFAVSHPRPQIALAVRQTRPHLPRLAVTGAVLGALLALAAVGIPRIDSVLLYLAALGSVYAVMLVSFVAVPARILGAKSRRRRPTEAIGNWTVGGALSAVAMTPGFVLDRLGLILLGVPGLHLLGFVLLSIGTALYAAGMSSVKAVKLSMKLDTPL